MTLVGLSVEAQISPGPLWHAHQSLEGNTNCNSCHSFGLGERKFKCLSCHAEIRLRLANKRGFHARVAKQLAGDQDCVRCHTEHLGPKFNIVKWEPSHDDFDHRQAGYTLEGQHAKVACNRCHTASHVSPAERKYIRTIDLNHTYVGVSQQCTTCHADEHRGQLIPDCARCHGFQSWKPTVGFDHATTRYPLTGLHEKVACGRCHRTLTVDSKVTTQYKNFPFEACANCHQDPHKGAFRGDCQSCHNTASWKHVRMSSTFDHGRTQFPLHGAHLKVECNRCHKNSNFKEPVAQALCADCHTPDPHKGQFPKQDCASCHGEDSFKSSLYTVARHQNSAYPLLGKHAAVLCAKCHLTAERDTIYHLKHDACVDCHQDAHGGQWKRSTAMTNEDRLAHHVSSEFDARSLGSFRREELQDFLDRKAAVGLSFNTVDHLRWDLKQIFDMAVAEGFVLRNPAQLLFTPRACPQPATKIMTKEEVGILFSVLDVREQLIARLAVLAGMRPGEIFALKWARLEAEYVDIQQRVYRGHIDSPKSTHSVRWAALSDGLLSAIAQWRELAVVAGADAWVFPSEKLTTPLSKDNCWRRHFTPKLKAVGLAWVNFQVMRKTHNCLMKELDIDPKVRAEQMGHTVDVNENVYTKTSLRSRREAVNKLESTLRVM